MEYAGTMDNMRRPNLWIKGIDEGEDSQANGIKQIFNRIIEENFPKLREDLSIEIQEAHRTPPFEWLVREVLETLKVTQGIAKALGYPTELEDKTLLLKTEHTSEN